MAAIYLTGNGYSRSLGIAIGGAILLPVLIIVVSDLLFTVRVRRTPLTRSLEEEFWLWTDTHPFSALLAAALLGGAVSHFFWAIAPPIHEPEVRALVDAMRFTANDPQVFVILVFLAALALHVVVGALLHRFRLHDFDWKKLGMFVEQDMATKRGAAILTTFVVALITSAQPGQSWQAAFPVALVALVGACVAATLPVIYDTVSELVQLVTGVDPTPPKA